MVRGGQDQIPRATDARWRLLRPPALTVVTTNHNSPETVGFAHPRNNDIDNNQKRKT